MARGLASTPHPKGLVHTGGEAAGGLESTTQGEDTDTVPGEASAKGPHPRSLQAPPSRARGPILSNWPQNL